MGPMSVFPFSFYHTLSKETCRGAICDEWQQEWYHMLIHTFSIHSKIIGQPQIQVSTIWPVRDGQLHRDRGTQPQFRSGLSRVIHPVHAMLFSNSEGNGGACVPLPSHPNLLMYLLSKEYVSQKSKLKGIWDEVHTERILHKLLEVVRPMVPLNARMELRMIHPS